MDNTAGTRSSSLALQTSDVIDVMWDPTREVFAIYAKTWLDGPDGQLSWKRGVVRSESKEFIHWSKPQLMMWPDEGDSREGEHGLERDGAGGGGGGAQLHGGPAFFCSGMYSHVRTAVNSSVANSGSL